MSTVDPNAPRRPASTAERRRRGRAAQLALLAVLVLAAAAAAFDAAVPLVPPFERDTMADVAHVAGIVGGPVMMAGLVAWWFTGIAHWPLTLWWGPTAAVTGGAVGAVIGATLTAPPTTAALVLAVALTLVALVLVGVAIAAETAEARRRVLALELVRTGACTLGVVTDPGTSEPLTSARALVRATFAFEDTSGTRRWVRSWIAVEAGSPLVHGERTLVWFDPAAPGDTRRILVEAAMYRRPVGPLPPPIEELRGAAAG